MNRIDEIRARCEEIPLIGYLVTAAGSWPYDKKMAYRLSRLTRQDIPYLLERLATVEKALRDLVAPNPHNPLGFCHFCDALWVNDQSKGHAPDCPWLVAKQLLEQTNL